MPPTPVEFDDDNPEWTAEDFARARYGNDIPEAIRAAFPVPNSSRRLARLMAAQGAGASRAALAA